MAGSISLAHLPKYTAFGIAAVLMVFGPSVDAKRIPQPKPGTWGGCGVIGLGRSTVSQNLAAADVILAQHRKLDVIRADIAKRLEPEKGDLNEIERLIERESRIKADIERQTIRRIITASRALPESDRWKYLKGCYRAYLPKKAEAPFSIR